MSTQVFAIAAASAAVTNLLGTNPTRFYLFGEAEQGAGLPYAVWQTASGTPENLINDVPKSDVWGVQVDAYATRPTVARQVANALRDAFEPHGYIVAWNGELRDPETRLFRCSFTVEFITTR